MDHQGEPLRPVIDIIEDLCGSRPHPVTVCRWCLKGAAGIPPLPTVKVQRQHLSTRSAVLNWLAEKTAAEKTLRHPSASVEITPRTPRRREADKKRAAASLAREGF